MAATDIEAWSEFPHHRRWFNKLDLSLRLGHVCGPCGVAPVDTGFYVVRPIYNLEGMGVGASKMLIEAGDNTKVPPGSFWCEWFSGPHVSVTYEWDVDGWVYVSAWLGERDSDENLFRFSRWSRTHLLYEPPEMLNVLHDVNTINVEYIGGNIIEVHLRPSPDPDEFDEMIPVWADQEQPPDMLQHYDNAGGFLPVPRVGFVGR